MRKPMVAGNWKMNTTVDEAEVLVAAMLPELNTAGGVDILLCPPFMSIQTISGMISGSQVLLGAQNVFYEAKGAYTGEISPGMLAPYCQYVILGHSERRQYFGEDGKIIGKKINAAIGAGIKPIFCIGEKLEGKEAGKTKEVLAAQLDESLTVADISHELVVAYEPVWAIGSGLAATAREANETIGFIRKKLGQLLGSEMAEQIRILYGGSVTPSNAEGIMAQPEIDGALVGGASLKIPDFSAIVMAAAS
ncbi:triose-phosphate isomerase [Chloroflexota bacterium]